MFLLPLSTNAAALRVFERKILLKIFRPVRVGDDFRIRSNNELYELLKDMDIVQRINVQRLPWLGEVVVIEQDVPTRKGFLMQGFAEVGEEDDQIEIVVTIRRRSTRSRGEWKDMLNAFLMASQVSKYVSDPD